MQPRLLDLFCGAGGAARGYQLAGFHVTGVDILPQPRYAGGHFCQADIMEVGLPALLRELGPFDAIHASPPCHDHSALSSVAGLDGTGWMLAATRQALIASGLPWVLENVPGADMRRELVLCGTMFGLRVYRHRWFESSVFMLQPGHPRHTVKAGGHKAQRQRKAAYLAGGFVTVTGNVGSYAGPAMGIDWMTGEELSQALPPAYTEWIGAALLRVLNLAEAAG